MATHEKPHDKLFKVANDFAAELRKIAIEDKAALEESGLHFNVHCLLGGQMEGDADPKLYLIYPQANWVEIGDETPYHIIGSAGYGKPVLDRTLKYDDSMRFRPQGRLAGLRLDADQRGGRRFPPRRRAVLPRLEAHRAAAVREVGPRRDLGGLAGAPA